MRAQGIDQLQSYFLKFSPKEYCLNLQVNRTSETIGAKLVDATCSGSCILLLMALLLIPIFVFNIFFNN